jgi:cytochrome bd ubiquinol oxidase subunit II
MGLDDLWFGLIAVLWAAYFVLEGFDFGVGMLLPTVGRDEEDRGDMLGTIGPLWDGNEVWLVVAGGATFAAFPAWYAGAFSGLYLAVLALLVCLVIRAVSFEWAERGDHERWRSFWRWANTLASVGAPLLWGIALSSFLYGMPLDSDGEMTGNILDVISSYTLLAGVAVVALFAFHGAIFLTIRTRGALRRRSAAAAQRLAIPAAVLTIGFLAATVGAAHNGNERGLLGPSIAAALTAAALLAGVLLCLGGRPRAAFAMTALTAAGVIGTLFCALYPRVLVSRPGFANSLTVSNAASDHYTLSVITVCALTLLPLVILYQGWTYHVFRRRLMGRPDEGADTDLLPTAAG